MSICYRTNIPTDHFRPRKRAPIAFDPTDFDPEEGEPGWVLDCPGTDLPKIATLTITGDLPQSKVDDPGSNPIPDCDTGAHQMSDVQTQTATKKKSPAKKSAKKTVAKKTVKKTDTPKNPGVIAAIITAMSRERGVTAQECLEILKSKFADRDPEKMFATVRTQLQRQKSSNEKDEKRGMVYFCKRR